MDTWGAVPILSSKGSGARIFAVPPAAVELTGNLIPNVLSEDGVSRRLKIISRENWKIVQPWTGFCWKAESPARKTAMPFECGLWSGATALQKTLYSGTLRDCIVNLSTEREHEKYKTNEGLDWKGRANGWPSAITALSQVQERAQRQ